MVTMELGGFPLECIAAPIHGNHGTRSLPLECIAAPIYGRCC